MNVRDGRGESAQSTTEYALVLTLIGAAAVIFLWGMGTSVSHVFSKMAHTVQRSSDALGPIKTEDK